jgi:multidrug resistance efflux pump
MFDAMTGQLVNPGSPVFFVVVFLLVVVGAVVFKKMNPDGFKSAVAKAKAEVDEIQARMSQSGPEFAAKLKTDLAEAKARLDALLK